MLCFRCVGSNLLHFTTRQSLTTLPKNLRRNSATSRMLSLCVCVCVCVCVCACVCVCVCMYLCVDTKHFRYEEYSEKKSLTGRKGIVRCSFRDGLPGRGQHIIKISLLLIMKYLILQVTLI